MEGLCSLLSLKCYSHHIIQQGMGSCLTEGKNIRSRPRPTLSNVGGGGQRPIRCYPGLAISCQAILNLEEQRKHICTQG